MKKSGQETDISVCLLSGCCFSEQPALRENSGKCITFFIRCQGERDDFPVFFLFRSHMIQNESGYSRKPADSSSFALSQQPREEYVCASPHISSILCFSGSDVISNRSHSLFLSLFCLTSDLTSTAAHTLSGNFGEPLALSLCVCYTGVGGTPRVDRAVLPAACFTNTANLPLKKGRRHP